MRFYSNRRNRGRMRFCEPKRNAFVRNCAEGSADLQAGKGVKEQPHLGVGSIPYLGSCGMLRESALLNDLRRLEIECQGASFPTSSGSGRELTEFAIIANPFKL